MCAHSPDDSYIITSRVEREQQASPDLFREGPSVTNRFEFAIHRGTSNSSQTGKIKINRVR